MTVVANGLPKFTFLDCSSYSFLTLQSFTNKVAIHISFSNFLIDEKLFARFADNTAFVRILSTLPHVSSLMSCFQDIMNQVLPIMSWYFLSKENFLHQFLNRHVFFCVNFFWNKNIRFNTFQNLFKKLKHYR